MNMDTEDELLEIPDVTLDSDLSEGSELEDETDFVTVVKDDESSHGSASPVQEETDFPRKKDKKPAGRGPGPAKDKDALQHYYEVLAEKLSADIAQTVVWEGAAKNAKIKIGLNDVVDDDGDLDDEEAALIAMLFSGHLDSEEEVKEHFLPAMETIATTKWEEFSVVAVYMLMMLLNKMPENGISLANNVLPIEVYYRLVGDTVRKVTEGLPSGMVKMPKPDEILTADEFRELLEQDPGDLGGDGNVSWIILLGYSPESIHGTLVDEVSGLPWSDLLSELAIMLEDKSDDVKVVVEKAKTRMVKTWGDTTTTDERKAALQKLKEDLDHKEFEKLLDVIMSIATFPLDDMEGEKDAPCLLVSCPTTQLAEKLFQHTMRTVGEIDVETTIKSLIRQKIGDQTLAAVIRELAASQRLSDDLVDDVLLYSCSTKSLIQSCAELLRVVPNPRTHPFMEILQESDEKTSYKALEILNPDLYAPNCSPDDANALHLAGTFGFTTVCKEILARGFHRLLDKACYPPITINGKYEDLRPASVAVQTTNFATAKELLQAMEPDEAKQLFKVQEDGEEPEIKLHQVMEEVRKGRGGRWEEEAREEGEWKAVPQWLEKTEVQERVDFLQTALDTTVEGRYVDLTVLTQDQHGRTSLQFSSGEEQKQPDVEEGKKKSGKSLYRKIAQSDCEELKSHECFATLTELIWLDYGIVQGLLFSLYLLFMAFLTTSLVLAARSTDPSQYDEGLDWFRLFCEVVTLLWVLVDLGLEVHQLGKIIYKSVKKHSSCVRREPPQMNSASEKTSGSDSDSDSDDDEEDDDDYTPQPDEETTNCCLALTKDVLFDYFLDWQNILDDLAILCILLIIPFRILDSDVQWVFASLTFMFHGLRIFKYAIMFKSVGEYVAILVLLIKRDVPQFVTVFLVIIFSLGGALYFALTGHYNQNNMDTENNNDTSEVYLLWWTGIRILAEGSALTYYGPGGFNWLGVLIYWLFLFIVVVVLLNILIAQFSKSYEEETERAQINVILTRTEIIIKTEQSFITHHFVGLVRRIRKKLTKKSMAYERVERLNLTGERDENKPASSEQVEELQTQTTNLGLQLRKQMDGTSDNIGKSIHKVEEMRLEIGAMVKDTREALQSLKGEMEGKLVGLERAVLDTRRYVDEIKEILMTMKEK